MARYKNAQWDMPSEKPTLELAQVAVLMDIRDELQTLNGLLGCPNFTGIPETLRRIRVNTTRKRQPRARRA